MHAQITYFDGPRSPEMVEASRRAGLERIEPAVKADPELQSLLVASYVLEGPDGGEVVISVVKTEAALRRAQQVIMATELLPGEDPALLPGPDRIETYRVAYANTYSALVTAE
jgi:hypothetical protein